MTYLKRLNANARTTFRPRSRSRHPGPQVRLYDAWYQHGILAMLGVTGDLDGRSGAGHAERVVDGPYFDRGDMEIKDALGDRTRPFRARTVDHVVGGQLFGRLDERPIRRGRFIGTPADGRRVLRVGQPGAVQYLAGARSWWSASCLRNTSARSEADIVSVAAGSLYISTMYFTPQPSHRAGKRI